jgi:hypothetical protein
VMFWVATIGRISGEMIGHLTLESIQRCLNDQQTPHAGEWLSKTTAVTELTRPSISANRAVTFPASRRYDRRNRAACSSRSAKRSSVIIDTFPIARMHNRSWRNFRGGSQTTTTTIRSVHQPSANCSLC